MGKVLCFHKVVEVDPRLNAAEGGADAGEGRGPGKCSRKNACQLHPQRVRSEHQQTAIAGNAGTDVEQYGEQELPPPECPARAAPERADE